jgi:hypothetical protein
LACASAAQDGRGEKPVLVLLSDADAAQWREWTSARAWHVLTPQGEHPSLDARLLALRPLLESALKDPALDRRRVYLAGRGDEAAAVFYAASRTPDLWSAAVAIGGSPQPAIDTNRFFAANLTNVPVLWAGTIADDEKLARKLQSEGVNLEWRQAANLQPAEVLEWLGARVRDAFPPNIDCESGAPAFASCYWIQMTKFDPTARNDVLPSSRLQPGSGAALDLGGFGYRRDDPGPGITVSWLPEKYSGPLRLNDRIVALGGKPFKDAREYAAIMATTFEEKPMVATVERGKERIRIETRIVLPKREEVVTARVQAKYFAEENEIQILSRTVIEMRVTVPEAWAGAMLNWNGTPLVKAEPGCWLLAEDKAIPKASKCP